MRLRTRQRAAQRGPAAQRSFRQTLLGSRIFLFGESGRHALVLLDDVVLTPPLDDALHVEGLMAWSYGEPGRLRAESFVVGKGHPDRLSARCIAALANEVRLLGDEAETLADLLQAFVDLPEQCLVLADTDGALVDGAILAPTTLTGKG